MLSEELYNLIERCILLTHALSIVKVLKGKVVPKHYAMKTYGGVDV
jgi:hypothetical protein